MLYEVLPDPRALVAQRKGAREVQVLQIHRPIPDPVQIGHFDPGGIEIVDEVVSRTGYLELIQQASSRLGDGLEVRTFLHFGPAADRRRQDPGRIGVHRLEHFTLASTPTRAIDPAPLAEARSMRSLRLLGHGLQMLKGFSELPAVKSLFVYDGHFELPWSELPATLTHFPLMTKAIKGRDAHNAEVRAKGLVPNVHPDSQFFYK